MAQLFSGRLSARATLGSRAAKIASGFADLTHSASHFPCPTLRVTEALLQRVPSLHVLIFVSIYCGRAGAFRQRARLSDGHTERASDLAQLGTDHEAQ